LSKYFTFVRDNTKLSINTTGGHASYLNGKIESPTRTIADKVRRMLLNSNRPNIHWFYPAEADADIYNCIYHSAIEMSPREEWYGELPSAKEMHVWGCRFLDADHDLKKSQDRACEGIYYDFSKSSSLFNWFDDTMDNCKHAQAARFFE
jgi:hypothetical protein